MGFSERFPRWITGILGFIQLLITAAIIGLELGSVYIDLAHGTIWAGFWSGIIFIMTFVTMLFISKYSFKFLIGFLFLFLKLAVVADVVVPLTFLFSIVNDSYFRFF
jgi:hypothetical protein